MKNYSATVMKGQLRLEDPTSRHPDGTYLELEVVHIQDSTEEDLQNAQLEEELRMLFNDLVCSDGGITKRLLEGAPSVWTTPRETEVEIVSPPSP